MTRKLGRAAAFLAVFVPLASSAVALLATRREQRTGPDQTTRRLRQAASFLSNPHLTRFIR